MGKNILIQALRNNSKTGNLFVSNAESIAYKTGFPTIDYTMGTNINVFDKEGKLLETYPSLGIPGGSYVTLAGKSAVGKTTLAVQIASNIVRPFDNGAVIHYDIERSSTQTRISTLSRFNINEIREGKYILRQLDCSLESLKLAISEIYLEKINNPDKYKYNSGKKNEFGVEIEPYVPTCIIVDSIASITTYVNPDTKEGKAKIGDITSQTDMLRLNGEISRFLKESLEMCKEANIILFFINHIKPKPSVGFPVQADLRYLKQDENLPCGRALQYYCSTMFRLTSVGSEKYTREDSGFDGFGVQLQYMKLRTNVDGTIVPLVFDMTKGYDSLRSSFYYAKSIGLIGGNKNGFYFIDNKDEKFRFDTIHEEFAERRDLYKIMYDNIIPILKESLSSISPEELQVIEEEMDY